MLGFPLLYFKGIRLMMFQLSSFYYNYMWSESYGLQLVISDFGFAT